jgi:DNA-3-methyladenine glycosylase
VLIRALEPREGLDSIRARRGLDEPRLLCAGPGRLLPDAPDHDGLPLDSPPFAIAGRDAIPEIAVGPRVGITRAADRPWRYALAGSKFVSRRI